jgi:hypothetical protein
MSEVVSSKQSNTGRHWLHIAARVLVAVFMVIAAAGFILSLSAVTGVWYVRAPTRAGVTDVTTTVTKALDKVDSGLARVNTQVRDARQLLAQVNNAATKLGIRVQANSPLVTKLSQVVDTSLTPAIDKANTTASAVHDAVVTVNSALVAVNRLTGASVPALDNALAAVSQRAQEAEAAVQDLRVTLANLKTGLVTKAQDAVTKVTSRIDAALARIQGIVNTYQAKVKGLEVRVTRASNNLLLLFDVSAVSLTILLIIFLAGLVLLEYFCWIFVRTGHFPTLRVEISK